MKNLLLLSSDERRSLASELPAELPVIVHPFYELRHRDYSAERVGGGRASVLTTNTAPEEYSRLYRAMPIVSCLEAYVAELEALLREVSAALVFEEWDVVDELRERFPHALVPNLLVVRTPRANANPYDAPIEDRVNRWYPELRDAIQDIGVKRFSVYGGNFFLPPEVGCAGQVLLFLIGLKQQELIDAVCPGSTAVLRPPEETQVQVELPPTGPRTAPKLRLTNPKRDAAKERKKRKEARQRRKRNRGK